MAEERKLVTILFADIVESTEPMAREDPELVRKTLSRTFAEMRRLLVAHGGTVEKFIGDAVMAVFGIPQAHDDDAERAVRAAFALRSSVEALARDGPIPLRLRIGVNSGQVVTGDAADTLVTGEPVSAAARLQQSAAPGEILVGALTRSLAGGVRFAGSRRIEAKGLGTLQAFEAEALLTAIPEQRRGLPTLSAPLIGRDAELRLLRESYAKAREQRGAYLVTIYGEAGIGKSRLAGEFVDVIGAEHVRRGRCLAYGSGITYWPLQEMLRADAAVHADDSRDEAIGKLRGAVLAAFGQASEDAEAVARRAAIVAGLATVEESLPEVGADSLGQELRWGTRRYFEQRAREDPLVLVFDDMQWAEEPLLEMLEHLAEWSRASLFLVCLARPELRDKRPGWGGGLMNAAAVRLEPLDASETRRLIAALLAIDELPEALRSEVVSRAQGNPLYVEEFLRMLIDSGHIARRDDHYVALRPIAELTVPASLHGILEARLDQLPAAVKRALQRAAVTGKVFYPESLRALGPLEGRVDDLLTAAARRDLVAELDERGPGGDRAWTFRHLLIRDVAYDTLPKEERSRLHDAFGRWLEQATGERRDEYAEIVAYHADQAFRLARELREPRAPGLGRRALDLLLAAARRARQGDDLRAKHDLHQRAREVAEAIGASLAERAEATGFAAIYRERLEGWRESRAAVDEAIALAREAGPSEVLCRLLGMKGQRLIDEEDVARPLFEEAEAAARIHGDPVVIADAIRSAAELPWYLGDLNEHARRVNGAYDHLRSAGVTSPLARSALLDCVDRLHGNAWQRGDFDALLRWDRELREAARTSESKLGRSVHLSDSARRLASAAGDFRAAAEAARQQIAAGEEFGAPGLVMFGFDQLGRAQLLAGDYQGAADSLSRAVRMLEKRSTRGFVVEARHHLAQAQLRLGDLSAARASAEAAHREVDPRDAFSRTTTTTTLALVREAEGQFAEAERLHAEALSMIEPTGYQFFAARTRLAFAEFLLRQGRAAQARPLLEDVRRFFDHPLTERRRRAVDELLRQCEEVRA